MDEYARFAFLYDTLLGTALRPVHASMLSILTRHDCRTVADLCCGTGLFCAMSAAAHHSPTGVDLSAAMLAQAVRRRPAIPFVRADATRTPFGDGTFDAATISFALHEKPRMVAMRILTEAARIVRPGGVIAVADYRHPEPGSARFHGLGIRLVERLAGRDHHAHFSGYMAAGATEGFLREMGMRFTLADTHMSGWVGAYSINR